MTAAHDVEFILSRIPGLSALVVGDICLDRWAMYDPSLADRSRETGLPRVAVTSCEVTPGGGGTVANNLAALGVGRVSLLGLTGDDGHACELRRALGERRIESDMLLTVPGIQTFTYTKLINAEVGIEDLPRVDFLPGGRPPAEIETALVELLLRNAPDFDIILVSDQAETVDAAVVGAALREALAEVACHYPEKIVWVDSRMRIELFRHVTAKCNRDEADAACRRVLGRRDERALRDHMQARALVVTQGPEDVLIFHQHGTESATALSVANPVDICGAGDSFSAGAAVAFALTGNYTAAAEFGNLVASVTIMKAGTGTASPSEIIEADASAAYRLRHSER
jgi:rfaE bifunctional protein kinase chain/domain